jgi:hypothetical protein
MEYYRKLDLDFDLFKFIPQHIMDLDNDLGTVWHLKSEELGTEINNWFSQFNLKLSNPMLFIYPPHGFSRIHIDGWESEKQDSRNYTALNFSKGGVGQLRWFDDIRENKVLDKSMTSYDKVPYVNYNEDEVKVVKRCIFKFKPIMLRTDIPHQAVNLGNSKRYCITLRWEPKLTFEECIELFQLQTSKFK